MKRTLGARFSDLIAPNGEPYREHSQNRRIILVWGYGTEKRTRPRSNVVWEREYGPLPKRYVTHHLNGCIGDDEITNLLGMPTTEHSRLHAFKQDSDRQAVIDRWTLWQGQLNLKLVAA